MFEKPRDMRNKANNFSIRLVVARTLFCIQVIGLALCSPYSLADVLPPVIFNAPLSARPGDIVGLQGENFGDAPTVTLMGVGSSSQSKLDVVNSFGTGWVSFKIPATATGALTVQVSNGTATSAPIVLNGARAYHLDALQIVPGGPFRLFGRNLLLPGFTPVVTVDGLPAVVDIRASDEHMLMVTAPRGVRAGGKAAISVDNGNGTGPALLDREIEVAAGRGDPFALGVGWGAGFSAIAAKVVLAASDARLASKVVCNGLVDDTPAIQAAIDLVAAGGGVLQLPPGTCRLAGSLKLKSRVVLQGAGKNRTVIRYEANYPLWGRGLDLAGVRNLTLINTRGRIESPLLQNSTRVFFQNLKFVLDGGIQMFLTNNNDFAILDTDFIQPKNPYDSGPYVLGGSGGLVFLGNTTTFANGSPTFSRVHDAYIAHNRFTRDARDNQNSTGVIHSLAMDFAHRIAITNNTFDVLGGPIVNKVRNDGETLLTEGGGARRTENLGTVASATSTTLSDPGNKINVAPFEGGAFPENYGVAVVGGKGAGQSRRVTAYSQGTLTVDKPWDVVPDTSSRYATFVWGLEKSLIKGNTLNQNPRGIWLYQTAIREVDIVGNTINEGGGIFLRSAQILKKRLFVPIVGVRIANNSITNTTKQWRSYISVMFVRTDEQDFGIGTIGVEVRNNTLQANSPNLTKPQQEPGGAEGFINRMHAEGPTQALSKNQTRLLGTIFQNNKCLGCEIGIIVRDGAKGTVQDGNAVIASPR
ncbi:MAG TPA: glycosyl hydrolase family 28-related protein [Rhodoferax sp.]|nr:glycosyl hydrolase family 28-related protein [Rhodoferax sp.]